MNDLFLEAKIRGTVERHAAGQQLVQDDARCIHVREMVDFVRRPNLLRAHVPGRADGPVTGLSTGLSPNTRAMPKSIRRICRILVEHQIARLDVAVHDTELVHVVQRLERIAAPGERLGLGRRAAVA